MSMLRRPIELTEGMRARRQYAPTTPAEAARISARIAGDELFNPGMTGDEAKLAEVLRGLPGTRPGPYDFHEALTGRQAPAAPAGPPEQFYGDLLDQYHDIFGPVRDFFRQELGAAGRPNPVARLAAQEALGKLGPEARAVLPHLAGALRGGGEAQAQALARLEGQFGDRAVQQAVEFQRRYGRHLAPAPASAPAAPGAPTVARSTPAGSGGTAADIKAGFEAMGAGIGASSNEALLKDIARSGSATFAKPGSKALIEASPDLYNFTTNPDGSLSVIGARHHATGEWTGAPRAAAAAAGPPPTPPAPPAPAVPNVPVPAPAAAPEFRTLGGDKVLSPAQLEARINAASKPVFGSVYDPARQAALASRAAANVPAPRAPAMPYTPAVPAVPAAPAAAPRGPFTLTGPITPPLDALRTWYQAHGEELPGEAVSETARPRPGGRGALDRRLAELNPARPAAPTAPTPPATPMAPAAPAAPPSVAAPGGPGAPTVNTLTTAPAPASAPYRGPRAVGGASPVLSAAGPPPTGGPATTRGSTVVGTPAPVRTARPFGIPGANVVGGASPVLSAANPPAPATGAQVQAGLFPAQGSRVIGGPASPRLGASQVQAGLFPGAAGAAAAPVPAAAGAGAGAARRMGGALGKIPGVGLAGRGLAGYGTIARHPLFLPALAAADPEGAATMAGQALKHPEGIIPGVVGGVAHAGGELLGRGNIVPAAELTGLPTLFRGVGDAGAQYGQAARQAIREGPQAAARDFAGNFRLGLDYLGRKFRDPGASMTAIGSAMAADRGKGLNPAAQAQLNAERGQAAMASNPANRAGLAQGAGPGAGPPMPYQGQLVPIPPGPGYGTPAPPTPPPAPGLPGDMTRVLERLAGQVAAPLPLAQTRSSAFEIHPGFRSEMQLPFDSAPHPVPLGAAPDHLTGMIEAGNRADQATNAARLGQRDTLAHLATGLAGAQAQAMHGQAALMDAQTQRDMLSDPAKLGAFMLSRGIDPAVINRFMQSGGKPWGLPPGTPISQETLESHLQGRHAHLAPLLTEPGLSPLDVAERGEQYGAFTQPGSDQGQVVAQILRRRFPEAAARAAMRPGFSAAAGLESPARARARARLEQIYGQQP